MSILQRLFPHARARRWRGGTGCDCCRFCGGFCRSCGLLLYFPRPGSAWHPGFGGLKLDLGRACSSSTRLQLWSAGVLDVLYLFDGRRDSTSRGRARFALPPQVPANASSGGWIAPRLPLVPHGWVAVLPCSGLLPRQVNRLLRPVFPGSAVRWWPTTLRPAMAAHNTISVFAMLRGARVRHSH
jgi:hypothetical protein